MPLQAVVLAARCWYVHDSEATTMGEQGSDGVQQKGAHVTATDLGNRGSAGAAESLGTGH